MKRLSKAARDLWPRVRRATRLREDSESGQSAYLELLAVMPLVMLVIVALAYFGRVIYANLIVEVAAYNCTRSAIEAMAQSERATAYEGWAVGGQFQGVNAARRTLQGFGLDPSQARVQVRALSLWDRGEAVRCEVGLHIDLSAVAWMGVFGGSPTLRVNADYVGQVEAYKSDF